MQRDKTLVKSVFMYDVRNSKDIIIIFASFFLDNWQQYSRQLTLVVTFIY